MGKKLAADFLRLSENSPGVGKSFTYNLLQSKVIYSVRTILNICLCLLSFETNLGIFLIQLKSKRQLEKDSSLSI